MTSWKTICLTFTFNCYSGMTVTGRNLNREIPKVIRGKSSFEKRSCGGDLINEVLSFFIFYLPVFFYLKYVSDFSLCIPICGQILSGLVMSS